MDVKGFFFFFFSQPYNMLMIFWVGRKKTFDANFVCAKIVALFDVIFLHIQYADILHIQYADILRAKCQHIGCAKN